MKFVAIDFETADYKRDSACALGIVKVEDNVITERVHYLIRPPRREIIFSYLHGIYWDDVKDKPTFDELWPTIKRHFKDVDFVAAHNATFDKSVLKACCESHQLELPDVEFKCTMKLSRELWKVYPTKLNNVCDHFGIELNHHNVVSDTDACAQIMIKALNHIEKPSSKNIQKVEMTEKPGIKFWQLGSSSGGNATLISDDETMLLVDCGFSRLYINEQLKRIGKELKDIDGVLITHLHNDHINPAILNSFIKLKIRVYCHINLVEEMKKKYEAARRMNKLGLLSIITDAQFKIRDFRVNAFSVPHDSYGGCFGFNLFYENGGLTKKISIATDIGYAYENLEENFIDSDILMIESNHDIEMLDTSRRSDTLKDRIKTIGHLSNNECSELITKILDRSEKMPKIIFLAHISKECNTPELALEINKSYLAKKGYKNLNIISLLPTPMMNVFNL